MKILRKSPFAILTVVLTTSIPTHAATTFDNGNATNLVSDPDNWDNGLPTGQQGTIAINATADSTVALSGYDVIHTEGVLSHTGVSAVTLSGGTDWEVNGASASTSTSFRGFNVTDGSSFTLSNGTLNTSSGRDWSLSNAGSTFVVNGGTLNLGRHFLAAGTNSSTGPVFTVNGGVITSTTGDLGARHFSDNVTTFNFNGGTTSVVNLDLQGNNTFFNFGGSSAGSLTAENILTANVASGFGASSSFNWLPGSQMTLTLTDLDDFAETFWNSGTLLFAGDSSSDLGGLSWADATDSDIGLGGGYYWDFNSTTNTLSLAAVPEPSSSALLGAGIAALVVIRRRRSA